MKFLSGLVAGAVLTVAVAVPVSAQSLGDLARKEAERRKTSPPAAKTYTNEDLKRLPPVSPGSQTEPTKVEDAAKPASGKSETAKGETTKDAEAAKDQSYWRGRLNAAKEEVRRNEAFRDALQSRINGLSADFTARDDPYQRAKLADDRQKAVAELARVTGEIEKSTKAIADIEEEARRAGVPPGWLR
jgi:hypothetical protein